MSALLRRVVLRPSTQPRRWGGGHAPEYGPNNPAPGEKWVHHPRPQDDWYRLAAFITIPTGLYYFWHWAPNTALGKKIMAYRYGIDETKLDQIRPN